MKESLILNIGIGIGIVLVALFFWGILRKD